MKILHNELAWKCIRIICSLCMCVCPHDCTIILWKIDLILTAHAGNGAYSLQHYKTNRNILHDKPNIIIQIVLQVRQPLVWVHKFECKWKDRKPNFHFKCSVIHWLSFMYECMFNGNKPSADAHLTPICIHDKLFAKHWIYQRRISNK